GGVSNYFIGNDRQQWRTGVPHYERLKIPNVYRGIDLVFYGRGADLEYDFVVGPRADPNQIRLAFDGADRLRVEDATGDLLLTTKTGAVMRTHRPAVYQDIGERRVEVAAAYAVLENGEVAFKLGSFDTKRPLVIDPTVSVAATTFLEGSALEDGKGIAV